MENPNLNRLSKYAIVLLSILSIFLVGKILLDIKSFRYIGSDVYPQNTITIQGYGEVFAIPDTATFSFSVVAEGRTAEETQKQAIERTNAIIQALKNEEIEEKDIKTINYNLYPRYEFSRSGTSNTFFPTPPGARNLVGYEINHTISVKVRKIDEAGKVLEVVGQLGASNISSISFTIGDDTELKREARKMAIDDAKGKAKELSKDLGVRLVRMVNYSEEGMHPFYARGGDMSLEAVPQSTLEIPTGENQIISRVHITYEIR